MAQIEAAKVPINQRDRWKLLRSSTCCMHIKRRIARCQPVMMAVRTDCHPEVNLRLVEVITPANVANTNGDNTEEHAAWIRYYPIFTENLILAGMLSAVYERCPNACGLTAPTRDQSSAGPKDNTRITGQIDAGMNKDVNPN